MEEKLTAILTQPGTQPVEVEITDADGKEGKAYVTTPAGIELYVDYTQLHGVESIDKDGKLTFLGNPHRTDEETPIYLVVKDRKEVLA